MDDNILIPTYISKYGCYSSACIFIASIFVSVYKYYVTAGLALGQSVISYFNWKTVYKMGWVKTIDIIIASVMIIYITAVDSVTFYPEYRILWYCTVAIIASVFIVNELLLYYQVKTRIYDESSAVKFSYFSLNYTYPGTEQRKYAYYRSTITHILLIHLLPVIVFIYCVYHSNRRL